jgi:protein SCO1/2
MKKLFALFALFALTLSLAGCDKASQKPVVFNNVDITGAEYARDFSLTDHTGKPRTLADFKGKVVFLFFGYTQCPDVCPTTMVEMAAVMKALGPKAHEQVQVLFVTVDPERDTQELLSQYVPAFHPSFIGLRGDTAATAAVGKEFKIFYAKSPGATPDGYSVDHTYGSYVFDRNGKIRLFVRHGKGPTPILQDIKLLLE